MSVPAVKDVGNVMEQVVVAGDLKSLSATERVFYYRQVCESLGLNPLTKPFDYLTLNNKLVLYARKDAAEQLRRRDNVSTSIVRTERIEDVYIVIARAETPEGRSDESTGAVSIGTLKGDALANAIMKAETKAKRRVTLSICGLGWLDETEIETIPNAEPVRVNAETGEIEVPKCAACSREFTPEQSRYAARHYNGKCQKCFEAAKQADPPQIKNPDDPITDKQCGLIAQLFMQKGFSEKAEDDHLERNYGIRSKKDLTKGQASELIEALQAMDDGYEGEELPLEEG